MALSICSLRLTCGELGETCYQGNRPPLVEKQYIGLPLGSIHARGWLEEMLLRQASGATGHMDTLYPEVMGKRNGWLGGDGDQWERGPYWIDGLLPLAYILDDEVLKAKVRPWIEWALSSQREDGYFGPAKDYPYEPGLQRDNSADWWPRMVMLKILQQYWSATQDERVIDFMSAYFRYQLETLPEKPLGHWTDWARFRMGDILQAVYWLFNITGEDYPLELADLLYGQGFDFVGFFNEDGGLKRLETIHCVDLAQGMKAPVIYWQQHPEDIYIESVEAGLEDIRLLHGQPQGMYGGDEAVQFGLEYYEVTTTDKWNYGLVESMVRNPGSCTEEIDESKASEKFFWNMEGAPVRIRVWAQEHPYWEKYGPDAGPLPFSVRTSPYPEEEIVLVPYGCTTLRISEFPVVRH